MSAQAEGAPDYLVGMTDRQVFDVLAQFKDYAASNAKQARDLLVSNPHITQALLQAQIKLKMVPDQRGQGGAGASQQPEPDSRGRPSRPRTKPPMWEIGQFHYARISF